MGLAFLIFFFLIAVGALALAAVILWMVRRSRVGEKHLEELKKLCLEPLLMGSGVKVLGEPSSLQDIEGFFKIPGIEDLDSTWIQCPARLEWCRSFTLTRWCPEHLYRDLENHWPGLYRRLGEVERLVREIYLRFAELSCSILDRARVLFSKEIEAKLQRLGSGETESLGIDVGTIYREAVEKESMIAWAVLLTILGDDIEKWGGGDDIRRHWHKELGIFIQHIASTARQVVEEQREAVEELKRIEAMARETVGDAASLLMKAMNARRLRGVCRYVKGSG